MKINGPKLVSTALSETPLGDLQPLRCVMVFLVIHHCQRSVLRHPRQLRLASNSWSVLDIPLPSEAHNLTVSSVRRGDLRVPWSRSGVADVDGGARLEVRFYVRWNEHPWGGVWGEVERCEAPVILTGCIGDGARGLV